MLSGESAISQPRAWSEAITHGLYNREKRTSHTISALHKLERFLSVRNINVTYKEGYRGKIGGSFLSVDVYHIANYVTYHIRKGNIAN